MSQIIAILLIAFFVVVAPGARAAETPPSEESIRELMRLNGVGIPIDIVKQNMQLATQTAVRRVFRDQALSEKQEKILSEVSAQVAAMFKEEKIEEALDQVYIDIYRKSLTQQEVDGLNTFYKSDAGKALIEKMPSITLQTIEITLRQIEPLVPKLNIIEQEIIRRMKDEK